MDKFRYWYLTHATEITWFVIGLCVMAGLDALARHDYTAAAINFGIAFVNYILNKR
mgnify:CR=1 FL=1